MRQEAYPAHIRQDGTVQTVERHCRETAEHARLYLSQIGLGDSAYLAGLIHDAGKCTDEFKAYIIAASEGKTVQRGSVIHAFAGMHYLLNSFHHQTDGLSDFTSEVLSIAVGSHHGFFDCFDDNSVCGFTRRLHKQPEYDNRAIIAFQNEVAEKEELTSLFLKSKNEIGEIIEKIGNISNTKEECHFYVSLLVRLITSAIVDGDRSNTRDFIGNEIQAAEVPNEQVIWSECIDYYNRYISTFPTETPIQRSRHFFSEKCFEASAGECGLYRLNLPTGGGKTLSGLRFALNHAQIKQKKRIFFLSPLLTILEQNADEIRKAIGNDNYVLEHHSDIVNEGKSNKELERYELLSESWNAPIVITSLVQFLNTLFSGKMSSVRRFHSLADSVIVIDEVQTVPPKMLSLFSSAINFLTSVCQSTVVLCSATQPDFNALPHPVFGGKEIVSQQDVQKHEAVFKRNQIENKGRKSVSEIIELISELLHENPSVLVICNKKSEAEELFRLTDTLCKNHFHLSAGMCVAHRKTVIEEIKSSLKNDNKVLCISTQVIEAGVDISFGAVIRFSAGIDNIVQAAGRCNRNGEKNGIAPVWIVDCENENLSLLKEIKDAKSATESLLDSYQNAPEKFDFNLSSEKAIEFYYQKLYSFKSEGFFDYAIRNSQMTIYSLLSDNARFTQNASKSELEQYTLRQAFETASDAFEVFEQQQQSVIVPYREGCELIAALCSEPEYDFPKILKDAKPFTVSVFSYQFEELVRIGAIHNIRNKGIYVLDSTYYDEKIGIISPKKGDAKCDTLIL